MRRRQVTLRLVGILLLASAQALFADLVSFTGLPANHDYGTYNGFASGTIDGTPFYDLICDDFDHTTYVPSADLNYNVSTLDSLLFARFVSPGGPKPADIENYRAAAILVQGLIDNPDLVSDYQYALWKLFTPDTPDQGKAGTLLSNALSLVESGNMADYADLFSKLRIYTPTGDSVSNQEFLQIDPPAPVPEPGSIILLLTVAALISVSRIRHHPS